MSRNQFDGLLGAMKLAGLIEIEEAEYEKDGEVRRYRKVRLTEAGLEPRGEAMPELLIGDGVVEEFAGVFEAAPARAKKAKMATGTGGNAAVAFTAEGEAVAGRIREWRAAEARRLGVPAYVVLHDRTVRALALTMPGTMAELRTIDGIGPAKVERYGDAILGLCGSGAG
jgi:superfamily II DNA helicase RecQ